MILSSKKNPRIQQLIKLQKATARHKAQSIIFDGCRELERAIEAGIPLRAIYYCSELIAHRPEAQALLAYLLQNPPHLCPLFELTRPVFEHISYRESPDGFFTEAVLTERPLGQLNLPSTPLLLITEGLEKPGNLGALIRLGEAAGVDALLCAEGKLDLFNPNAIRASQGLGFSFPTFSMSNQEALTLISQQGCTIYAAVPSDERFKPVHYWDCDFTQPTALLLGNEHAGLSSFWLENASAHVTIPQYGKGDSLNIATAAAVLTYEAIRQRQVTQLSNRKA